MKTDYNGGSRDDARFNPVLEERIQAILDGGWQ
jgi:hypothetical protein